MKRLGVLILVLLLVSFITCCLSYADDNTIYGCYQKNNGQLRIVKNADECRPPETSIQWNKAGPQGPPGSPGLPGPAGPPGVGSLGVYDGSGLFLGYLVDSNFTIFNPDIPAFLMLARESPPRLVGEVAYSLHFTTDDCTLQAYFLSYSVTMHHLGVCTSCNPNLYYVYDTTVSPVHYSDIRSEKDLSTGSCNPFSSSVQNAAYPVKQIDVPLLKEELHDPIVVKPIQ